MNGVVCAIWRARVRFGETENEASFMAIAKERLSRHGRIGRLRCAAPPAQSVIVICAALSSPK